MPVGANSEALRARYDSAADDGASMELIVAEGQGHNMWEGFFRCEELVEFVLEHARSE